MVEIHAKEKQISVQEEVSGTVFPEDRKHVDYRESAPLLTNEELK